MTCELINTPDSDHFAFTPLCWAAFGGNVCTTRALLLQGADPTIGDSDGWTPAHIAASKGHFKSLELLLAADSKNVLRTRTTLRGHRVITKALRGMLWHRTEIQLRACARCAMLCVMLDAPAHWHDLLPGASKSERSRVEQQLVKNMPQSWGAWSPATHDEQPKAIKDLVLAFYCCRERCFAVLPDVLCESILEFALPAKEQLRSLLFGGLRVDLSKVRRSAC